MIDWSPQFQVLGIFRIALNVADLNRSIEFYQNALGFSEIGAVTSNRPKTEALLGGAFRSVVLHLGDQHIELTAFRGSTRAYPIDSRSNDLWFQHFAIVTDEIEQAAARLHEWGATVITVGGPVTLPSSSGSVTAYKFRDPDGHPLELLSFPKNTLPQECVVVAPSINHTALSVSKTAVSLTFYQHLLGLSVLSQQLNTGPTQEQLDDLPTVLVEVTALAACERDPHLELLCYQTPAGRQQSTKMNPSDRAASRIVFQIDNLSSFLAALTSAYPPKSVGRPVVIAANLPHAALVCDPDGHLLLFEQAYKFQVFS